MIYPTLSFHTHPLLYLTALSLLSRLIPLILLTLLQLLPISPFDTSHLFTPNSTGTIRWDAIHFLSIAKHGYQYEQQFAFQPLWMGVVRVAGWLIALFRGEEGLDVGYRDLEVGGVIVSNICSVGSTSMMYLLTKQLTSPTFALSTTLLYLLPPTPAVLSSPYTENLYALCTMGGYYFIVRRKYVLASLALALGSGVRSTGIFGAGLLAWAVLTPDKWRERLNIVTVVGKVLKCAVLCSIVVAPFLGFQYYAYYSFCVPNPLRPWCSNSLPMVYSFVQGEYWNVGFLRYWTTAQIPNLLIAAPVLYVSLSGTIAYLRRSPLTQNLTSPSIASSSHGIQSSSSALANTAPNTVTPPVSISRQDSLILAFHLHHLAMTLLLIFSSHTQIALRVISGDPVFWWNVTIMAFGDHHLSSTPTRDGSQSGVDRSIDGAREDRRAGGVVMTTQGRVWVWYTLIWGAVSIVLWAGHYPPA